MPRLNNKKAREARIACEKFREFFKYNIDLYHLMHTFVLGEQWEQQEEDDMIKTYRKIRLTANKLGTMSNSLLGEQQQNTPQLQVVPMTECDQKVANLREIIIKDIMFSGDATLAVQVAAKQAAIGGYGAYLIDTDYEHDKSFDLDIVHRSFKDATKCYWDVAADSVTKTDGILCGYISRMSRLKFRELYGKDIEENIYKNNSVSQTEEEIALAEQPNEADTLFTWSDDKNTTILDHF